MFELDLSVGIVICVVVVNDVDKIKPELEGVFASQIRDSIHETGVAFRPADAGSPSCAQVTVEIAKLDEWQAAVQRIRHARIKPITLRPRIRRNHVHIGRDGLSA